MKIIKEMLQIGFLLFFTLTSCDYNKTYLTDEEKKLNPYSEKHLIIFESHNGELDSLYIDKILYQFPEGLGVKANYEIMDVKSVFKKKLGNYTIENKLLSVHAKTKERGTRIKFGFKSANLSFYSDYFDFLEFTDQKKINLKVKYGNFNDVIVLRSKDTYSDSKNAVKILYWSKSAGYVKFDKYDGTTWELKEIKSQKSR